MKFFNPEDALHKPNEEKNDSKSEDTKEGTKKRCPVCLITERNNIPEYDHINPKPELFDCDYD